MKSGTNPGHFLGVCLDLLWNSVPFLVRLPIPRFLSNPYFKMLGCRSRADVATWRRRDVETSRRGDVATLRRRDVTELLTSAMLTRRRDVVTSRRHHVATWQPLLALLCLASQKLLLITALFTLLYLQPHQTQNQGSSHKNYEIPIK